MTTKELATIILGLHASEIETINAKAKEYASATDRLHNFKKHALNNACTPLQSAWSLMSKNFIALQDAILSGDEMSKEFIDEKLGDTRNYLALIYALWSEKNER